MDNDKRIKSVEDMLKECKSEELLKESFKILMINKKNKVSRCMMLLLSVFLALFISLGDTIPTLREILSVILDTDLAVFGIIFTGYTLFQALLNGKLIAVLIENENVEDNSKNTLHETNWNFIQLMMQFIMSIFFTLGLKILLECMPDNYLMFNVINYNVILSTVLLLIYFYHLIVCLWRMVSFVFNIYQLFNSYAVSKYISFKENGNKE